MGGIDDDGVPFKIHHVLKCIILVCCMLFVFPVRTDMGSNAFRFDKTSHAFVVKAVKTFIVYIVLL